MVKRKSMMFTEMESDDSADSPYSEEGSNSKATKRKRRRRPRRNSRCSTGSRDSGNASVTTTSDEHEEDALVVRTMEHLGLTLKPPLKQMTREEQGIDVKRS